MFSFPGGELMFFCHFSVGSVVSGGACRIMVAPCSK